MLTRCIRPPTTDKVFSLQYPQDLRFIDGETVAIESSQFNDFRSAGF
jgi:hypothetical protein